MVDESGAVVLSPVNTRERGYAQELPGWWNNLTHEETPELLWPMSVLVYDRMRRQESQVGSVLRAVTAPIVRTQWSIDGTGCDPVVTQFIARNLGLPIKDADPQDTYGENLRGTDRFSWQEHLSNALLMLVYGHYFFEQVYRLSDDGSQLLLRKLGPRPPRTIARLQVARDGGLVSITQRGVGGEVVLPVSRLVAYVMDREGSNWLGQSLLRPAYKNWLLKDRALRTWSQVIDRQGMGLPVYTAGPNETSLDAGEDVATTARSGDNSGAAIPNGAKLELLGVQGALPDIEGFVRYQDEQIARAVLAHFLNLGTQTGSWALGSTFADFFTLSLQMIAEVVRSTATAHIVEDLVDLNFGTTVPAPQIVFDEIGSRVSELDRVRQATGLTNDADLVKFVREHSDPAAQPTQEAS